MVSVEGVKPLSPKQIEYLLSTMKLIIDTREKKISHITDYLDLRLIDYVGQAMKFADYSFILPACPDYGINEDVSFTDKFVIERKKDLTELANNIGNYRDRFERELEKANGIKFVLMIENANYHDVVNGNYRSEIKKEAFVATLATYEHRYKIIVKFKPDIRYSGNFIVMQFKYYLREWLKNVNR